MLIAALKALRHPKSKSPKIKHNIEFSETAEAVR
jgi:hypothetical protein